MLAPQVMNGYTRDLHPSLTDITPPSGALVTFASRTILALAATGLGSIVHAAWAVCDA